ncbi:MAG TPA: rhomboid family intramembrane serine protease [Opitutaceae bacterium]|nr:rhomboid family intramembrane serine protease [Opitutaceae bacterium]
MQSDASGATPELSFPVRFQVFGGSDYNSELRGKGTLTVRAAAPTYTFAGRKRLPFVSGGKVALEFGADDIWNVTMSGRTIRFSTTLGQAGRSKRPFVFMCRDAPTAATVAALLPQRKDEDFVAAQNFAATLDSLSGGGRAWQSVTNLIIAVNAVVFVVMAAGFGTGWFEVADILPYVRYGANNGAATTDGEWWRLVTCMFMHYGILHLAVNMWALFQAGHLLEKLLGRAHYLVAYFGSGIVGSLVSVLWHGDRMWSVGASGAIFGVYGALLGYMLREKHGMPRSVVQPLFKSTAGFAAYNLFYGLVHPGIDNAAHLGGFLSGIAIGWLVALPVAPEPRRALGPKRLLHGVAACGLMFAIGVAVAPRYDYRPIEELGWESALKDVGARENALVQDFERQVAAYRQDPATAGAAFGDFLEHEFVPFYQGLVRQLGGLHYSTDHRTERRRLGLLNFAEARVTGAGQLLAGLRAGSPSALAEYQQLDAQAAAALQMAVGSEQKKP